MIEPITIYHIKATAMYYMYVIKSFNNNNNLLKKKSLFSARRKHKFNIYYLIKKVERTSDKRCQYLNLATRWRTIAEDKMWTNKIETRDSDG